jgi:hypothetical protein
MRPDFISRVFRLVAIIPMFCTLAPMLQAQDRAATISLNKWAAISLPFRPTAITATATTFWVCGADEMIAKSSDGGKHWKIMHENHDGEVLMAIYFPNETIGFAAGSNGRFISTGDGGETWKTWAPDTQTNLEISFADDEHGLRRTDSGAAITSDGGVHWAPVVFPADAGDFQPPFQVLGIAALSATNLTVSFAQSYGEHIYLSTTDDGESWKTTRLDNIYAGSLYTRGGEYWAFGIEYVDRQNRGGHGVGVALHSIDGRNWLHGAPSPHEFYGCAASGCILDTGGFADLSGTVPRFASLPTDAQPSRRWAFVAESICSVDLTLECASATPSESPSALVLPNRPIAGSYVVGAFSPTPSLMAGCLVCPLTPFALAKNKLEQTPVMVNRGPGPPQKMYMPGLNADLGIRFVIRKDGSVDRIDVSGAPQKEIEAAIRSDVRSWLFTPLRENGAPVERKSNVQLRVTCMAFGGNDEATCGFHFPQISPPPKP